jgi:zinc D-Ala-D-Ala carboxypeptidase
VNYWQYLRGGKQTPAPVLEYESWEDVPFAEWPWLNFKPAELACKGTGRLKLQRAAVDALQELRQKIGKPMRIASAYRSPEHNAMVQGSPNSRHMVGDAFDVVMVGHDPAAFEKAAREAGFRGIGHYPESNPPFMHIDMGPARKWGTPFPKEK